MIALMIFVTAALVLILIIALLNTLAFPRLHDPLYLSRESRQVGAQFPETLERSVKQPSVSILIPARNEAAVIGGTVRALLAQQYAHFELIVLDDGSEDGTPEIASRAADGDPRVRVIASKPLPRGWLGKTWACHQLAQAAAYDTLIFTDADVHWQPNALTALVHEMERSNADLLAVWPTQQTITWGERLVVPLIAMVIMGYLPVPLVNRTRFSAFAAANGQCLAFRRAAYQAMGGHRAVRGEIVEDMALARRAKRGGLRLWMVDANELIACRMYRDWQSVREGFAKNIVAGYGGNVGFVALAAVFHWLIFVAPWLWAVTPHAPRSWAILLIALGLVVRALTAAVTHQRIRDALWMPVSVVLMTAIALQAVWWQWHNGGPRWKGRTIPRRA